MGGWNPTDRPNPAGWMKIMAKLNVTMIEQIERVVDLYRQRVGAPQELGHGRRLSYEERVSYEERILSLEMQLVPARRTLVPFAAAASGWEDAHPGSDQDDGTLVPHRLGDLRASRPTIAAIDRILEAEIQ